MYFLRTNRFVKVGVSINPEKRVSSLQTANPFPIEDYKVVWLSSKKKALTVEKECHKILSDYSIRGEWFKLPSTEREEINEKLPVTLPTNYFWQVKSKGEAKSGQGRISSEEGYTHFELMDYEKEKLQEAVNNLPQ